jgi:hypothetical protein
LLSLDLHHGGAKNATFPEIAGAQNFNNTGFADGAIFDNFV